MRQAFSDWRDRLPRLRRDARPARWILALLAGVLLFQLARLIWALASPIGMVGDWRAPVPTTLPPAARLALFGAFDPFFRDESPVQATAQVTSLSLQLFGTRINEGSGQGSAIIAGPDGVQSSFAVGDEVMPGVTLKEVAFDHVVIDRGGTAETLYLDQSGGTRVVETPASATAPTQIGQQGPVNAPGSYLSSAPGAGKGAPPPVEDSSAAGIGLAPRTEGGRTTGIAVAVPAGLEAAGGLRTGDIITQVNGKPVGGPADLATLRAQLVPGGRVSLVVERGSATVPVTVDLGARK
jgi:general secretion pathway protein C